MKKYLLTFFLLCGFQSAHAEIIDNDSFTTDTTSGLDWLDVTASQGLSYNEVVSQMGSGGLFEGWRYASTNELYGLFLNTGATLTYTLTNTYVPENENFDLLIQMLGPTDSANLTFDADGLLVGQSCTDSGVVCDSSDTYAVNGMTDYSFVAGDFNNQYYSTLVDVDESFTDPFFDRYYSDYSYLDRDMGHDLIGSFLVRTSSVPEPSSLALLGLGILGLMFGSRRKLTS